MLDNKNIIKSNIKDTLSSALIIIRDNILIIIIWKYIRIK